jgi:predicted ABC-type ATPase
MIAQGESFAFESTLSGRTWLAILKDAIDQGYEVTIYFLYLDSIKKNLQRIKKRVLLGGHPIPTEAVHRRHPRCFGNFWHLYRPLCADWYLFDNSGKKPKSLQSKSEFEKLPANAQNKFSSTFLKGKLP